MKQRRRARFFIGLAILLLLIVAVHLLLEAIFDPWARSLTGAPTLTGQWLGEMTTATGRKQWIWLHLEHDMPVSRGGCASCPDIGGAARTCDSSGGIRDYRIWGDVENWRGTKFHVKTLSTTERPGEPVLGTLQGRWNQRVLDLTTELVVPGATTTTRLEKDDAGNETYSVIGGHPDARRPIHWRMQRGTEREFETRCLLEFPR